MANDAIPGELQTELNRINTGIGRYIARAFTYVVTPLILPLATAFAYWIQNVFGMDLDAAELTGYLSAVAGGIGISAYKWIANRGEWEQTVLTVSQWYKLGREAQSGGQALPPPPPR